MYINSRLFLKAHYLALFRSPFRLRRWAYVIFFSSLFLAFRLLVVVGRAIDHVFFPGFRRQGIHQPVFIIAPPRSGTTLLQNLLSLDEERFVHLKMYQTIFPAVCFEQAIRALLWLDRQVGRPGARLLAWCERKWFGAWDDLHKMRLNQPEEDDALFLYAFESEAIYLLFPYVNDLWEAGFPDALPPAERRKLMGYYRTCLQRHLYANGPTRTLLSKSTQSSGSVEALLEEFPDAKFITIVRDPRRSVASHVSVFIPVWLAHSPDLARNGPEARAYGRLAVEWFKHLFAFRRRVPPGQYYCVDYRDLAHSPRETIERLYAHFGWPVSPDYRARLETATQQQRSFKSKHQYSLEEFGMTEDWIRQELGELLQAYGIDSEKAATVEPEPGPKRLEPRLRS